MNFYKRFIGDITAKTGGLSMAQMGAYDRLLDHYYSTESPIDAGEAYRICRAMSKLEKTDVDSVLSRFWELGPKGYTQSKADEVIAKALPLIEAARANGKKGGRPKKPKTPQEPGGLSGSEENTQETLKKQGGKTDFPQSESTQGKEGAPLADVNEIKDLGEQKKPNGFAEITQTKPSAKATQSQSQITPETSSGVRARKRAVPRPEEVTERTWDDWSQLRTTKKAPITETVVLEARREAAKAGLSLERFLVVWCARGSQGLQADWLKPHERGRPAGRNILELDHREGIAEDGSLL